MPYFDETNSTEETRDIRNKLHQSNDPNLAPLAFELTDWQIKMLREAFKDT